MAASSPPLVYCFVAATVDDFFLFFFYVVAPIGAGSAIIVIIKTCTFPRENQQLGLGYIGVRIAIKIWASPGVGKLRPSKAFCAAREHFLKLCHLEINTTRGLTRHKSDSDLK